jgi:hypothetical protein
MPHFDVIFYETDREGFLNYLSQNIAEDVPSSSEYALESDYRRYEIGENFHDLSFHIAYGGKVAASVLCHKLAALSGSGFNGTGAKILAQSMTYDLAKELINTLRNHASRSGLKSVKLADENNLIVPELLSGYGASPIERMRAIVDLREDEAAIFAQIRKSYKSLINQGKRLIKFEVMTQNNPDWTTFLKFKNFHMAVAGRQTRSDESWKVQYDMIIAGCAELSMGYMEEHGLVSSALFTDLGDTTSYAVAVYNRDLFDLPLAHANVFEGIIRAKRRGKKFFNLGVFPKPDEATEKELNIAKFKKGFTDNLQTIREWDMPVA